MWQLGHSAGAISTAPQVVAVAAQLQGWMLAWGIRGACQIISEHFWIDGGECGEGRAVSWSRPDRAASCCSLVHQRKPCHSRALPGDPRPFFFASRRKESNEVGYE
jgi:hypothetical protein